MPSAPRQRNDHRADAETRYQAKKTQKEKRENKIKGSVSEIVNEMFNQSLKGLLNEKLSLVAKFWLNELGKKVSFIAEGFFARTVQHEYDHLHGILFTSKVIGNTKTEKELDNLYKNRIG